MLRTARRLGCAAVAALQTKLFRPNSWLPSFSSVQKPLPILLFPPQQVEQASTSEVWKVVKKRAKERFISAKSRLALKTFVNLPKQRADPKEGKERQPGLFARLLRLKGQNKNLAVSWRIFQVQGGTASVPSD
jgi:hypothetical protein